MLDQLAPPLSPFPATSSTSKSANGTSPSQQQTASLTSVPILKRNRTHVKNVGGALLSLQPIIDICLQCIQLIRLRYISALIVHTLPNIVLGLWSSISVLTLERNLTHVKNVGRALHVVGVSLIICVLDMQLIRLRYTSALIVHTLPNIVLMTCNAISVHTRERNLTHVKNVGRALHVIGSLLSYAY